MAWHSARGDSVRCVFLADGETSRAAKYAPDAMEAKIAAREAAARSAATILGAQEPRFRRLPDNRLDAYAVLDLAKIVEREIAEFEPSVIYTHSGSDLNVDHRQVRDAVLVACRPLPQRHVPAVLLGFEVLSSTEWGDPTGQGFKPSYFVDIGAYIAQKVEAMREYGSEMSSPPHPRSEETVRALAQVRGSQCGRLMAEAFETIRHIQS